MADIAIKQAQVMAVPTSYTIPGAQEILIKSVRATFDGTSAAGSFVPTLQIVSPGGTIVAECPLDQTLAAGVSADVSFFPGLKKPCPPPPPSPNPLGTLFAWFDFSDSTTITLDGSGNISYIKDKTGNGHDLSQPIAANRPGQTTINALSAGAFSLANQTQLNSAAFTSTLPQPGTVTGVFTETGTADATHFPGIWDSTIHALRWGLFQNGNFNQIAAAVGTGGNINTALTVPYSQQLVTVLYNGGGSYLRLNAVQTNGSLNTNDLSSIILGTQSTTLPGPAFMTGAICEVLYYKNALTVAQQNAVESYLRTKWATP